MSRPSKSEIQRRRRQGEGTRRRGQKPRLDVPSSRPPKVTPAPSPVLTKAERDDLEHNGGVVTLWRNRRERMDANPEQMQEMGSVQPIVRHSKRARTPRWRQRLLGVNMKEPEE